MSWYSLSLHYYRKLQKIDFLQKKFLSMNIMRNIGKTRIVLFFCAVDFI